MTSQLRQEQETETKLQEQMREQGAMLDRGEARVRELSEKLQKKRAAYENDAPPEELLEQLRKPPCPLTLTH